MSTATIDLLDRYQQALGLFSDNAAASSLGVKRQTISNWRRRGTQGEARLIQLMCDALGEEAGPWLIRLQHEQAFNTDDKLAWRRLATQLGYRLSGLTAIALMLSDYGTAWLICSV